MGRPTDSLAIKAGQKTVVKVGESEGFTLVLERLYFNLEQWKGWCDSNIKNLEEYELVECGLIHQLLQLSEPRKTFKR